jgi:nucleotide-binding universal stress UspA family protein
MKAHLKIAQKRSGRVSEIVYGHYKTVLAKVAGKERFAMVEIKHILYPTDFSEHSLVALPIALDLVGRYGATFHCLHVLDVGHEFFLASGELIPCPMDKAEMLRSVEEKLDRFIQDHVLPSELSIRQTVVQGTPFIEIIRYCRQEEIDLIVLGTHGHSALASMLLGSVVEKVVRKAPCAVLSVRHPEHRFEAP